MTDEVAGSSRADTDDASRADAAARDGVVLLREDDPRATDLLADGWVVAQMSWGARLTVPDTDATDATDATDTTDAMAALVARVEAARRAGWAITRLSPEDAERVVELDAASIEDYPGGGPATAHTVPDPAALCDRLADGWDAYGGLTADGRLDCVTVLRPDTDRVETEFTVTRRQARGRGLATGVKAFAVLDQVWRGNRTFGTGGADGNEASLRMNQALGYVLEPRWLSLRRP